MNSRAMLRTVALSATAALILGGTLVGCSSSDSGSDAKGGSVDAAKATSAADFGGIDGLVKAAKKEGQLNVIALPEDWANYGKIIKGFEDKYGITVNSASPDASSAEEIQAADNLKGQDTAPDVFDLGAAVALANTAKFAPYQVEKWDEIPDANKEKTGLWVNNYSGIMSIGYDSAKVPEPKKLDDLLDAKYKGAVALNGDPTQAGAAFAAVGLIAAQNGGGVKDFGPGVDFVGKLKQAGNFLTVDPTPATIASGETPVVFDWSFNNVAAATGKPSWKTTVLPGAAYVSFYNEAISKDAPNPAAARLWQEWIFSDEAQALYLEANAVPVRVEALKKAGSADEKLIEQATFGTQSSDWISPDAAQVEAANKVLADRWAAAVK
ncbi:ABC transporter substrate-binding protein [Leucobacter sp. OLJS4]|uniref:ABC transporter substrate-binding protein n=1 Tax=unclassified Leucobacter TaxID=2621730 RepID=UPI000C60C31E|nr:MULTISPECIES: ABC transporter substrate-binding protein [unclassified Leucobacter]PII85858.1 ABC transporter substrate-binding protein [Leucobacter sp. OLCALW19]PII87696.1 ABC transporter substrate-binding protein [Leucobacter sp. OLTLW20]PII93782.1 ABC transporter substrate-binding protein [Leucobacter sp. OLAS13]PII96771.1 ABC transporter substrate-binding protein [Leucobacter sp. OLCS4]PII98547.1 ABC transporter substrate-binding protein [Leucobacter sp. OLDS2]